MEYSSFGLVAADLERLQSSSAELLDLLKLNLPERTGAAEGWNFEKAHSILHKVREIVLFGWSENYSTQVNATIHIRIAYYIVQYTTQYSYLNHGRDLNIVILTSAKDWKGAPTTWTSFSASCAGTCVLDTCCICARWTRTQRTARGVRMGKQKACWAVQA